MQLGGLHPNFRTNGISLFLSEAITLQSLHIQKSNTARITFLATGDMLLLSRVVGGPLLFGFMTGTYLLTSRVLKWQMKLLGTSHGCVGRETRALLFKFLYLSLALLGSKLLVSKACSMRLITQHLTLTLKLIYIAPAGDNILCK